MILHRLSHAGGMCQRARLLVMVLASTSGCMRKVYTASRDSRRRSAYKMRPYAEFDQCEVVERLIGSGLSQTFLFLCLQVACESTALPSLPYTDIPWEHLRTLRIVFVLSFCCIGAPVHQSEEGHLLATAGSPLLIDLQHLRLYILSTKQFCKCDSSSHSLY